MADVENDITETPKTGRGWPKGKPRAKKPAKAAVTEAADRAELRSKAKGGLLSKMKATPNWESEDFVGVGNDYVDRLKIPPEIIMALHRDGVALQWGTHQVRGRPEPQELSKMTRGGWTPVHNGDFDGLLEGLFIPKGREDVITVDDSILMARPTEIHTKAKMMERRNAAAPMQILDQQIRGIGLPNVSGSGHRTALAGNHITRTVERIEIPE